MPRHINPSNRYQGKPCRNCNGTERYIRTRICTRCYLERVKNSQERKKRGPVAAPRLDNIEKAMKGVWYEEASVCGSSTWYITP